MPDNDVERRDELVTLLVPAAERSEVARRLLAAAEHPRIVRTTSRGFRVPRRVAVDADLLLAEDAAAAPDEQPAGDGQPVEQPAGDEQPTKSSRGRRK